MEFSKRKWGFYLTLFSGAYFKLKFLYFKKNKHCSMQRHFKRNELWCFLFGRGTMSVLREYNAYPVGGDALFVPVGKWHQYISERPTLVLEVQWGDECREDDIERLQ